MKVNPPYFFYVGKFISADPYWILARDGSSKEGESSASSFLVLSYGRQRRKSNDRTRNSHPRQQHRPMTVPPASAAIPLSHPMGSAAPLGGFWQVVQALSLAVPTPWGVQESTCEAPSCL